MSLLRFRTLWECSLLYRVHASSCDDSKPPHTVAHGASCTFAARHAATASHTNGSYKVTAAPTVALSDPASRSRAAGRVPDWTE